VLVPSSACDFHHRLKSCSRWILCRSARRCPGLLSVRCSRGVLHSRVLVQVPTAPEVVSCSVLQFTVSWVINSRARSWFARFSDPVLVSFAGLRGSVLCESFSFPSLVFFDCTCRLRAECLARRQFHFCGPRAPIPTRLHHCCPVRHYAIPAQDFLSSV
jgi:hypothetical protein